MKLNFDESLESAIGALIELNASSIEIIAKLFDISESVVFINLIANMLNKMTPHPDLAAKKALSIIKFAEIEEDEEKDIH